MQEQRQHHWPDADDNNDNDKNGDDDDDHLTYEERLRVDSHKMLMPIIHLPYKPYQYQYRLCNKSLHCDNNDNDTSHQHQRQQGIVRRVSDDSVDVAGIGSDTDDDEEPKGDMKEDKDDCKTHEQKYMQDRKKEGVNVSGYQHQMSIKTCDGNGCSNSTSTTTTTESKRR